MPADTSNSDLPITMRTATEADYPAIATAIQAWWTQPGLDTPAAARERVAMVPRLWLQHFAATSTVAHIGAAQAAQAGAAHVGAALAGFLIAFFSQDVADEAYIHFVGVAPDQRGRGIGRKLYERFFTQCASAGRVRVRCITSPANALSIAFHEAMGFTVGPAKPDYDGPGSPRVTFVRSTQ